MLHCNRCYDQRVIHNYFRHSWSRSNIYIILVRGLSPPDDHKLTDISFRENHAVCTDQVFVMPATCGSWV
jgi:hypothetical protein